MSAAGPQFSDVAGRTGRIVRLVLIQHGLAGEAMETTWAMNGRRSALEARSSEYQLRTHVDTLLGAGTKSWSASTDSRSTCSKEAVLGCPDQLVLQRLMM